MSKKHDILKQESLKYFYIYQKDKSLENSFIYLLKKVFRIVAKQKASFTIYLRNGFIF